MARMLWLMVLFIFSLSMMGCGGGIDETNASSASAAGQTGGDSGGQSGGGAGGDSGESGGSGEDSGGNTGGDTGGGNPPPPSGNASAMVYWSIPVTRQSGTPLKASEIGGYKIYYGTSSSNLSSSIDVPDAYQTSWQVGNLLAGTVYYFRITAYDKMSAESTQSNLITRTAL